MPKVSVIIPAYNSSGFIEDALESVFKQTYRNYEVIVVDDGSTDKSAEIIGSFSDKRIIYIYQENHGVSVARNKGILESKGEYIAFLDSDDLWLPEKLEKQVAILNNNKNTGLVYTDFDVIHEGESSYWQLSEDSKVFYKGNVFNKLFMKNLLLHLLL